MPQNAPNNYTWREILREAALRLEIAFWDGFDRGARTRERLARWWHA